MSSQSQPSLNTSIDLLKKFESIMSTPIKKQPAASSYAIKPTISIEHVGGDSIGYSTLHTDSLKVNYLKQSYPVLDLVSSAQDIREVPYDILTSYLDSVLTYGRTLLYLSHLDDHKDGYKPSVASDYKKVDKSLSKNANLVASCVGDSLNIESSTMHAPVLDLDFPATLVPSSTPGHFHLYLDKLLNHEQYMKLLDVLAEVGILEEGYVDASKKRGFTSVRLPGKLKTGSSKYNIQAIDPRLLKALVKNIEEIQQENSILVHETSQLAKQHYEDAQRISTANYYEASYHGALAELKTTKQLLTNVQKQLNKIQTVNKIQEDLSIISW